MRNGSRVRRRSIERRGPRSVLRRMPRFRSGGCWGGYERPDHVVGPDRCCQDTEGQTDESEQGGGSGGAVEQVAEEHAEADHHAADSADRQQVLQPRRLPVLGPHLYMPRAWRSRGMLLATSSTAAPARNVASTSIGREWTKATATAPPAINADHRYMITTARACVWPICSNRWCRCRLSGVHGACPVRVRRATASNRSMRGTARIATGISSGSNAGRKSAALTALGSTRPVRLTVAAASINPSSIDPESPMKTRAGLKLCGKKPMQAPVKAAVSSVGAAARSKWCTTDSS